MRVLVTYSSDTGNTEKIAEAIHMEASLTDESEIKKINHVSTEQLNLYDLIFAGSPCHGGDISPFLKNLLDIIPGTVKFILAGFITHAAPAYEKKDFEKCFQSFEKICTLGDIKYMGCFDCQGKPSPVIQSLIKESRKIPDDKWAGLLSELEKHPDNEDVKKARDFARKVLKEVSADASGKVMN